MGKSFTVLAKRIVDIEPTNFYYVAKVKDWNKKNIYKFIFIYIFINLFK